MRRAEQGNAQTSVTEFRLFKDDQIRIKVKSVGDTIYVVERYGWFSYFGSRASDEPSRYKIKVALPSSMTSVHLGAEQVTGQGLNAKTIVMDVNAVNLKQIDSDRLRIESKSDTTIESARLVTGDIRSYRHATVSDVVTSDRRRHRQRPSATLPATVGDRWQHRQRPLATVSCQLHS